MIATLRIGLKKFSEYVKRLILGDVVYHYQHFSIRLPRGHQLPKFQKNHAKYDRFLPHLVRYLRSSTVVDVGANCGDTLAGMVDQNPHLQYLCIEPDSTFFTYLEANIVRMTSVQPNLQITVQMCLVGESVTNVALDGTGGTKHAVPGAGTLQAKGLDQILESCFIDDVSLLKVDVDGFDYDVLDSGRKTLSSCHPLLFFECQYFEEFQKSGFEKTLIWLSINGYDHWVIFDNFGEVLIKTNELQYVLQLINYVWSQNAVGATRTIFYFDILACSRKDLRTVEAAVNSY